jgi:hypothetical protein
MKLLRQLRYKVILPVLNYLIKAKEAREAFRDILILLAVLRLFGVL